jgi:hypothetical protein
LNLLGAARPAQTGVAAPAFVMGDRARSPDGIFGGFAAQPKDSNESAI